MFKRKSGFTLLELMIVVIIIGILAMLAIPRFFDAVESAKVAEAKGTLNEVYKAFSAYNSVYGSWPSAATITEGSSFGVDLDNDGTDDIVVPVPVTDNFAYSNTATELLAAKSGNTQQSWKITLDTGKLESYGEEEEE